MRIRKAFTLLELIVVIVILALLASITVPTFKNIIDTTKLETIETTAAAFARETVALASLDTAKTNGLITQEHAQLAASDMPQLKKGTNGVEALTFDANTQVVFSNWEFSGNPSTISVKLADKGARMGVAISYPEVGCAFAKAEGTIVTSWNVKGIDAANCSGALALVDEIPELSAPPAPAGLKLGWGKCEVGGLKGWDISWADDKVTKVDIYVNGVFAGVGLPGECLVGPGEDDNITVVPRKPVKPGEDEEIIIDDETQPGGWTGGSGQVGEVLDDEVIEIPTEPVLPANPHNPSNPEEQEKDEIVLEQPAPVIIIWDKTKIPADADEIIIIRNPDSKNPVNKPGVKVDEEFVYDDAPAGENVYVARPVKDGKPVGPDLPIEVEIVKTPAPVGSSSGSTSARVIGDSVTINWGAVANTPQAPLSGYKVFRSASANGPWTEVTSVGNDVTSFTQEKLTPGTYCYAIKSFGPGGESSYSASACATVIALLAAPENVQANPMTNAISVTWNAMPGAINYVVYNGSVAIGSTAKGSNATQIKLSNLSNNTEYNLTVRAVNSAGEGAPSATVKATPNAMEVRAAGESKEFIVPYGVESVQVEIHGSDSGVFTSSPMPVAGKGAHFKFTMKVKEGDKLYLNGSTVLNNGGTPGAVASAGKGGGASDIRLNGTDLSNRIVVAGGGGGPSAQCKTGVDAVLPGAAPIVSSCSNAGASGTLTTGGAGGGTGNTAGMPGTLGKGGNAYASKSGGGGGDGYYGGGGGSYYGGPGGAGSSYIDANVRLTAPIKASPTHESTQGYVILTY